MQQYLPHLQCEVVLLTGLIATITANSTVNRFSATITTQDKILVSRAVCSHLVLGHFGAH